MDSKVNFSVDYENLEVTMTRVINATAAEIFQIYTNSQLVSKWWGPSQYSTTVDKMEVVVGGTWRFIQKDSEGNEFAFNGVYKEIIPNKKLVFTFEYEPMPGHILLETVTFEESDGKTFVTDKSKFSNLEDIKGMVASGMEGGAKETMERLATLAENS